MKTYIVTYKMIPESKYRCLTVKASSEEKAEEVARKLSWFKDEWEIMNYVEL